jgi:cytochrome c biogenesis protein ResB
LLPIALMLVLGALVHRGRALRLLGGLVMLVAAGMFTYQLHRTVRDGDAMADSLGSGWYAAVVGGLLGFMSGLVPGTRSAHREVWLGAEETGAVTSDTCRPRRRMKRDLPRVVGIERPRRGGPRARSVSCSRHGTRS